MADDDMPGTPTAAQRATMKALQQSVKLRHKVSFVAGCMNMFASAFLLGSAPIMYFYWHSIKAVCLLAARIYRFQKKNLQYYLFDFCYAVNVTLLAYLWLFPNSPALFRVVFGFANGPLIWSIVAFRNSLVLHSIDHMTSLWLHLSPAFVTWTIRWYHTEMPGRFAPCETASCTIEAYLETDASHHLWTPFLPGFAVYFAWFSAYYLVVFWWKYQEIQERNLRTLYTSQDLVKIVNALGTSELARRVCYFGSHMLFSLFASSLTLLWWSSFTAHTILICFLMMAAAWNGAGYYFEVFAARYLRMVEKRALAMSKSQ